MTTWRELGYVPNSDDEDLSDGELSTQEDEIVDNVGYENELDIEDENVGDSPGGEVVMGGDERETIVVAPMEEATPRHREGDTVMDDINSDTVQTPRPTQTTDYKAEPSLHSLPEKDIQQSDEVAAEERRGISVLDLSNQLDELEPQLQAEEAQKGSQVSVLDLSNIQDEENDTGLQDIRDSAEREREREQGILQKQRHPSPDPITGEEQDFLYPDHTISLEGIQGPHTPSKRQDFRQPAKAIDSSPVIDSSPLSSPPSIGATPSPPPPSSAPQFASRIQVVVPTRREAHEQWTAPIRSFRERKPIQVNPYLIEGERYRQTLKSRGVKPLRINEVEVEVERAHAGDDESQEAEYVAPPEPVQQPRRRVPRAEDEMQPSSENNAEEELPSNTVSSGQRQKPHISPPSEKRRKMAHTYSKRHLAQKANQTPGNSALRNENTRLSLTAQTNGIASDVDIYDLPLNLNSSPRGSRTPLAHKNLNQPLQPSGEEASGLVAGSPQKRRGLLAVLDSSSESDLEPSRSGSEARPPLQPSRREKPLIITLLSSPPHSSSNSEEEEEYEEEDESQTITRYQRKTNGVLPASWWKLDRNKLPNLNTVNRREESPRRNDVSRPGVARAKVTSRARTPEGVFLLGDDSDSSSDEPVIVSSAPARALKEKEAPAIGWIDLDDIMEDDKIDRMLPGTSRKQKNTPNGRKKRDDHNKSSQRSLATTSGRCYTSTPRQGTGSTRLRQPKITDHVSSKRKPTRRKRSTAPRVGIIDAVRHYKNTTTVSPPSFIKVAVRAARERSDQGRHIPSRKLFMLETEMDTRDVQAVLKDWRGGALSFAADSGLSQDVDHEHGASKHQPRLPSPQRLSENQNHSSGRQFAHMPTNKAPQSRRQRGRQTTLSNIVRREAVAKNPAPAARSRPKSQVNPVTAMPGRSGFVTHRPNFAPQPAQLETDLGHVPRRLHQVPRRAPTPDIATLLRYTAKRNPHLARFMEDEDLVRPMSSPTVRNLSTSTSGSPSEVSKPSKPVPRTRRKRVPRRIDAETIDRRQPPPQDIIIEDVDPLTREELPRNNKSVLHGLLSYGNKYSLNFDTTPLKPGTIFNSETFIGDESLSKALNTPPVKDSRRNPGRAFTFGDKILYWGVYEDSVAAEFETIMNQIADGAEKAQEKDQLKAAEFHCLTSQVYSFYVFFSNYLSQVVSFPDSIDIISFGQRVLQAIDVCCDRVVTTLEDNSSSDPRNSTTRFKLQLLAFSLVFAFQISKLTSGDAQVQGRLEVEKSIRKFGHQLLGQLVKCGLDAVRSCYEDQRQRSKYEKGIGREHYVVEAWIIAIQVLGQVEFPDVGFWQFFNMELRPANLERALDIRLFEKHWRMVFTILPLHQFNNLGVTQQPLKETHLPENWALLKVIISQPLKIYNANPEGHPSTINNYLRVLYARCHHLISSWGWTNPDIIIPTLYEFFASNNLANLRNEREDGSAEFLQDLERNPSLAVRDPDRCFHLLLKIIAIGINSMKVTSTIRKIGNLVSRLMPNHRRQYPKENDLRIEDLSALKNHHDLLAILYWAAPPTCRPHLDAIRNLVDPETSHCRACNVSIRTWSNLLRFQLHSGEDNKSLGPFMDWFEDLITQTLNQHHAVPNEMEKEFKAAKDRGDISISESSLKANIKHNQRELENILSYAVKSLDTALSGIRGQIESAIVIFTKVSTANILNSYNRLSHKLVMEVLQVVQQYLLVCKPQDSSPLVIQVTDEDSQDYGDWSGFDDLVVQDQKKPAAEHLLDVVYDSLRRMLSNCFGADKQPEESLLVKVVDTWSLVIEFLVQNELKNWGTYLDSYSSESWSSLRDTEQTRKFTAYFMPKIIQSGANTYESNKTIFISFWLKTLVERQSMLKFQNKYTATLLNCDPENPMFTNLPFVRDESSGIFVITQNDFRLRRLSLISTVLANMRDYHEAASRLSIQRAASLKNEYSDMLMAMMKSMKENYKELQTTTSASGEYVEFIHQVVEYLQQYSTDLVNIDRFFTDSTSFPLPTTDPEYVVGRLKNYGLKLHHTRNHKALFSLFQSLCERAAVDRRQDYLISQLTTALSGNFEHGDPASPTLRGFFMGAIFPVYAEFSFSQACGWILAVPILKASEQVIIKMREDIDSTLYGCVKSVLSMLTSLLEGMRLAVGFLAANPSKVISSSALGTLTLMVIVVAKVIPIVDWLSASGDAVELLAAVACDCACYLIKYFTYIKNLVENREGELPVDIRMGQKFEGPYESGRKDCAAALKNSITKEWANNGGSWYIARGGPSKEVHPPPLSSEQGGLEMQKELLKRTIVNLLEVACRTEMFGAVARSADASIWEFEGRGKPYINRVHRRKQHGRALQALENLFC